MLFRLPAVLAVCAAATHAVASDFALVSTSCGDSLECSDSIGCGDLVAPPAFGGCLCERSKLTGDWCGLRNDLAAGGITADLDATLFYFGNTSGGLRRQWGFAGHDDYVVKLDGGKLGWQKGLFVQLRAEHRYGQTINNDTGTIVPATILPDLPVRDSEEVYLTNVLFTQFLSESVGVFAGKLDTLDGDPTAFACGRGKTQFSNFAMIANPIALRTVPYATLGTGFFYLYEGEQLFNFTILNSTDTARTAGFDELFNEGATLSTMLRLPTQFGGLPGHQLIGGTWSSRNYISLGQDPRIILPDVPIARGEDSWSLFWNCDQYLVVDPCNPKRGWGLFGRAGVGDDDTNPLAYFWSAGLGGASMLASRPADTWGVGYYYLGTSDEIGPLLNAALGPIGDGDGVELFYNIAFTTWCHITPDLQVLNPARENVDTAVVAGVRAQVEF